MRPANPACAREDFSLKIYILLEMYVKYEVILLVAGFKSTR